MSDIIEEMYRKNPFSKFSVYTQVQIDQLKRVSDEILGILDRNNVVGVFDGNDSLRSYGLFWLWVLGAYEVFRTMKEHEQCFSEPLRPKIRALERELAQVRMPFAKQQLQGQKDRAIGSEPSIVGVGEEDKDLLFQIEGNIVSCRKMLKRFTDFIQSVNHEEVLLDLRDHPNYRVPRRP
ncbi:MAG: hypothetical protein ABIP82_07045 [Nitrospirales bacterium]